MTKIVVSLRSVFIKIIEVLRMGIQKSACPVASADDTVFV
jgi:hypothetical protein